MESLINEDLFQGFLPFPQDCMNHWSHLVLAAECLTPLAGFGLLRGGESQITV